MPALAVAITGSLFEAAFVVPLGGNPSRGSTDLVEDATYVPGNDSDEGFADPICAASDANTWPAPAAAESTLDGPVEGSPECRALLTDELAVAAPGSAADCRSVSVPTCVADKPEASPGGDASDGSADPTCAASDAIAWPTPAAAGSVLDLPVEGSSEAPSLLADGLVVKIPGSAADWGVPVAFDVANEPEGSPGSSTEGLPLGFRDGAATAEVSPDTVLAGVSAAPDTGVVGGSSVPPCGARSDASAAEDSSDNGLARGSVAPDTCVDVESGVPPCVARSDAGAELPGMSG